MIDRARALAALQGLAIGDALGMPTQLMSRERISEQFGVIDGFRDAASDHPIAAGMRAGSITDDTEQALLLARALIERNGDIDPADFAYRLAAWEESMRARGSLDLLGPSTRAAVAAVLSGTAPDEAGRSGSTNGAAMRVTPVGIACSSDDLPALVEGVRASARVSHDTGLAIAGAAAIAAAVSAGVDGANWRQATQHGIEAARLGARLGHWVAGADVADRIAWAITRPDLDTIVRLIGTSLASQESVPAAFAMLALSDGDGWRATCLAASAGGDTDTIAAMAGAIAGACGWQFSAEAISTVVTVNDLDLSPIVDALLTLRRR